MKRIIALIIIICLISLITACMTPPHDTETPSHDAEKVEIFCKDCFVGVCPSCNGSKNIDGKKCAICFGTGKCIRCFGKGKIKI